MAAPAQPTRNAESARQDELLVWECLHGNRAAWSALIDKYKNLIFSIPIKRGLSRDEASDIFQSVCLSLVSELPRLREPRALAAWLIQTTSHQCFRRHHESMRYAENMLTKEVSRDEPAAAPEAILIELEREQMVREAVSELSADCQRLVELLFYRMRPLNYDEIADTLRVPKGSIGPTRMRCLERLRKILSNKGFG